MELEELPSAETRETDEADKMLRPPYREGWKL